MAKFYGDGSMNLGLVRGKVRRAGGELLQVEFVGYEADGVQETQVSDCRLVEAPNGVNGGGGGGAVSSSGGEGGGGVDAAVLEVGCGVLAKFYEDGSMNPATIRGVVVRGGVRMYQCEFVGYESDGVQDTHPADVVSQGGKGGGDGGAERAPAIEPCSAIEPSAPGFCNRNAANYHILKAVICAGLYPNVIVVDKSKSTPKLATRAGEVFLHPACLDAGQAESLKR
jgi:hypothetical protein